MVVILTLGSPTQDCCESDVDLRYTAFQVRQNNFKKLTHAACFQFAFILEALPTRTYCLLSFFHIYSFVRIDQSLFPSLEICLTVLTHIFDCANARLQVILCLQSLQTAFCGELWSGSGCLTTCAHLPSPDLVSRFHLLLCYFTHMPCFAVTCP